MKSAKLVMGDAEAKSLAGSRARIEVSLQTQCKKKKKPKKENTPNTHTLVVSQKLSV